MRLPILPVNVTIAAVTTKMVVTAVAAEMAVLAIVVMAVMMVKLLAALMCWSYTVATVTTP